ncbi:MAG: helix-turn-helix transcriptional regulator [Bacteroidota bacterium]|nr:helix-turn-helix transcriptional regulator [Bacteroidota bacterium]
MKAQIQKLLSYYQLSAADFAKVIGVNASGLSHILGGKRNYLSIDTILKIIDKYPAIDLEWLILGKGEMLKSRKATPELFPFEDEEIQKEVENESPENSIKPPEPPPVLPNQILGGLNDKRKVEKILVFYSDKSYDEFINSE